MKRKWMILESDNKQVEEMRDLIKRNFAEVELYCADNLKDAYKIVFDHTIDLFIVNVVLDEENETDISGIQFVRNIRDIMRYIFAPVIYITSLTDHELYVYTDPNCMGYIRIPYREKDILPVLTDALKYKTLGKNREVLYIRNKQGLYAIKVEDILYMEYGNGVCEIHTVHRDVKRVEGDPCKQSMEEMESLDLIQCGRNRLVNHFYIESVNKAKRTITLRGEDSMELSVGPSYLKEVWNHVYNK